MMTTKTIGAVYASDCVCQKGHYWDYEKKKCLNCPPGMMCSDGATMFQPKTLDFSVNWGSPTMRRFLNLDVLDLLLVWPLLFSIYSSVDVLDLLLV